MIVLLTARNSFTYSQISTKEYYNPLQARLHYGFIIAHSEAVQNTAGSHPMGIEVELFRQRVDTAVWDYVIVILIKVGVFLILILITKCLAMVLRLLMF